MKAALLGNGPSRKFYDPSKEYAYRIGCNIPWADVDATVITDDNVVVLWKKNNDLIKCPVFFSQKAWMFTDEIKFRPFINENNYYAGMIDRKPYESSGNSACRKLVELGYKEIDIYGCDAYFTKAHGHNTKSYTREIGRAHV